MVHSAVISLATTMIVFLAKTGAASTTYSAPALTDTLASSSQSYLIGVISFIMFSVFTVMSVWSLMDIDYSGDSLLTVDVEPTTAEE
mmetsp:Transcript_68296/g.79512  ORF Transcript_68296/g.79512 Transcript_68296/m.79512 type:complete len:87 (+) Transcript_68296:74-334(+)